MLTLKDAASGGAVRSASYSLAVYKGLTVCVYNIDTPELTLTRRDLIDLVNVRATSLFHLLIYTVLTPKHRLLP